MEIWKVLVKPLGEKVRGGGSEREEWVGVWRPWVWSGSDRRRRMVTAAIEDDPANNFCQKGEWRRFLLTAEWWLV